jgi:hypothetical protein|nr:MAG TPA: hypothetical protein [Caudoviricetes sp.]
MFEPSGGANYYQLKMKQILFSNNDRAKEVAQNMNPNSVLLENFQSRGNAYHKWIFSDDAVVVAYTHGHGKYDGRFAVLRLIKGTAWKVGRDEDDIEFYNQKVVVEPKK